VFYYWGADRQCEKMKRRDGRENNQIRHIKVERAVNKHAEGSCLFEMGVTKVLCTVTVENNVPFFMRDKEEGWLTAEYRMLPRSAASRINRDRISGRVYEIQRLIGRSLRSIIDLKKVPAKTFIVDCDVLQADGGTRTASINAGFIALLDAVMYLMKNGTIISNPIKGYLASLSVGVVDGEVLSDLTYQEDSSAEIDMNVVMNNKSEFVELQGTSERRLFDKGTLNEMLSMAERGIKEIIDIEHNIFRDFMPL